MDELWDRVRAGRHTVVLGDAPAEPPAAAGVRVVRVRCDVPEATLGPLHEARRKVEHLLGSSTPLFDQARERMVKGLRKRLLGEMPALEIESAIVELLNRLARSDRAAALIFEAADAADEATLATLRRILARPGWLELPVVLVFRTTEPHGAAAALIEAVRAVVGADCVLRDRAPAPAAPPPSSWDFRALPPDVLRVLRAGAVVGSGFEADLVAELLGLDLLDVLDLLQRAADAGVPIEDLGEARFHLPEPMLDALRASMLPSLMIAWHQALADLLGGMDEVESEGDDWLPPPSGSGLSAGQRAEPPIEGAHVVHLPPSMMPDPQEPAREAPPVLTSRSAPPTARGAEPARPGPWPYAEIFAPGASGSAAPIPKGVWERMPIAVNDAGAVSLRPRVAEAPRPSPSSARGDDARAAGHLDAAGDLDASAERYHAAARQAAEHGAYAQALAFAEKARAILASLPISPRRRRLLARVLLELGKLAWHATGPVPPPGAVEPAFTLGAAIETLEEARAALSDDDPPELSAEIATVIAGVCYDLGDLPSLTRALDELATASRLLMAAGDPTGAARLLNDQAAVYVRLGDPVQATHLLTESRKIFEERAAGDPVAALEMAETDHLFARIPLHVAARPGRESDALTMGLDHAIAAERAYKRLDAKREIARVWETMGRLELRKGRLDRARDRLTAAVAAEESIGDLVGLARSTAALSELLAEDGRIDDALALLSDSVALNLEKGSPIGLAFNRRALVALDRATAGSPDAEASLDATRARLESAERILGRMKLPGERD